MVKDPSLPRSDDTESGGETLVVRSPRSATGAANEPRWPAPGWPAYEPLGFIGAGGMAQVFRAFDPTLRRRVAIKFLHTLDPEMAQRLLREARAQARLDHPGICKVFEVGEVGGRPYIAMQLIEGRSLDQVAPELSIEQRVAILRDVALAVHAANSAGLIHRDLKPANIMVAENADGLRPFVVDFGIARDLAGEPFTVTGATMGTPAFMAPEVASGERAIDRRVDVYSLGATLFTILADRPPFLGDTALQIIMQVLEQQPPQLKSLAPHIARDLQLITHKCLEKSPDRRYASARDLADDLGRFLAGEPVHATAASLLTRLGRRLRKHRALTAVAAIGLGATLVMSVLWWQSRHFATEQTRLMQKFNSQIEQIESILWKDQSLPLHDTTSVRRLVTTSLQNLEQELPTLGQAAEGPGQAALGRGYLSLGDEQRAREHFELALSSGYESTDVALGLGRALAGLYNHEIRAIDRITDPAERARRREAANTTFRDPALVHLLATGELEQAEATSVRALIAMLEGRTGEALALAEDAFEQRPWLFETRTLVAHMHLAVSQRKNEQGRHEEAMAALALAEAALDQARHIARSSPLVHNSLCHLKYDILHTAVWRLGQAEPERLDAAVAACEDACLVNPSDPNPASVLSHSYSTWAEYLLRQGEDPSPAVALAIMAAERSLRLDPDAIEPLLSMSAALLMRGKYEMISGHDPRPSFEAASQAAERALAVVPDNPEALARLGLVLLERGNYEQYLGEDPSQRLEGTMRTFTRASILQPTDNSHNVNLALAASVLLSYQVRARVGDAEATAAIALAALDHCDAIDPNYFWSRFTRGRMLLVMASQAIGDGREGDDLLQAALASLEQASQLHPGHGDIHCLIAEAHMLAATRDRRAGRDPSAALNRTRAALTTARRLGGTGCPAGAIDEKIADFAEQSRSEPVAPTN